MECQNRLGRSVFNDLCPMPLHLPNGVQLRLTSPLLARYKLPHLSYTTNRQQQQQQQHNAAGAGTAQTGFACLQGGRRPGLCW